MYIHITRSAYPRGFLGPRQVLLMVWALPFQSALGVTGDQVNLPAWGHWESNLCTTTPPWATRPRARQKGRV